MSKGLAKQQGLTLPSIPTLSLEHLDYMDRLDFSDLLNNLCFLKSVDNVAFSTCKSNMRSLRCITIKFSCSDHIGLPKMSTSTMLFVDVAATKPQEQAKDEKDDEELSELSSEFMIIQPVEEHEDEEEEILGSISLYFLHTL